MITCVRFCLSYDLLKLVVTALKMDNISRRKRFVDTDVINDFTSMRLGVIICVVIFMTWRYPLNNSDVIW